MLILKELHQSFAQERETQFVGQAARSAIHQRGGPLLPLPPPGAEANGPEEEEGEEEEGGGGGDWSGAGGCEVKNKDKKTIKTEIF